MAMLWYMPDHMPAVAITVEYMYRYDIQCPYRRMLLLHSPP